MMGLAKTGPPLLPPEAYLPPVAVRPFELLGCKFGVRPFGERDRGFFAATWGRTCR